MLRLYIHYNIMNKREFKKAVTSLGSGMVAQMFNLAVTAKNADRKSSDEALAKIWNAMESAKHKANTFFGKKERDFESKEAYLKAKKEFFKTTFKGISKEFSQAIDEALKTFNKAMPKNA